MADIGVRKLKTHASEIVRQVKESGAHYIVTHRGRPVAAIVPLEETQVAPQAEISAWDELVTLGEQISQNWQSPRTSAETLSEMRK